MKKLSVILFLAAGIIATVSCSDIRRKPGTVYMPDMAYSRAYETYITRDSSFFTMDATDPEHKIFYNNRPVPGTVMRGEDLTFTIPKDNAGDTSAPNYKASMTVINPITSMNAGEMKEAERLFLINCAICHGAALDGNGPLYKGGNGPYPSKPATLVGDAKYEAMPAGQMYYSVTYGKNQMGSYASQLNRHQRWMIITYIKSKQAKAAPAATTDSTATAKK